jgi:hypothetical protein
MQGHLNANLNSETRFEVCTAVKIQVAVFWIMAPCSVVVGYQRFRGPCCLHLQHGSLKRRCLTTTLNDIKTQKTATGEQRNTRRKVITMNRTL